MSSGQGLCLPSRPPGDPAGMEALAQSLRTQAAIIADLGSTARSHYGLADFEGPAATRIAGRVDLVASGASSLADRLVAFASTLNHAASELAAQQAEYDRLVARLEAEGHG